MYSTWLGLNIDQTWKYFNIEKKEISMFYSTKERKIHPLYSEIVAGESQTYRKPDPTQAARIENYLINGLRMVANQSGKRYADEKFVRDAFPIILNKLERTSVDYMNYKIVSEDSLCMPAWLYYINFTLLSKLCEDDASNPIIHVAAISKGIRDAMTTKPRRTNRPDVQLCMGKDLNGNRFYRAYPNAYTHIKVRSRGAISSMSHKSHSGDTTKLDAFVIHFRKGKKKVFVGVTEIENGNISQFNEFRVHVIPRSNAEDAYQDAITLMESVKERLEKEDEAEDYYNEMYSAKDSLSWVRAKKKEIINNIRKIRTSMNEEDRKSIEEMCAENLENCAKNKDDWMVRYECAKHDYGRLLRSCKEEFCYPSKELKG